MTDEFRKAALDYHEYPQPGKVAMSLTTSASSQYDLALAYSPGVAEPVRAIAEDPQNAYRYTAKGNLVAVISDGSAILGLGDLGPLASKPVMEGKSLLFKRFAGIDSVDIEVDVATPEEFIETVARIANTFGGINLEDIKAPQCFAIEQELKQRCSIPVFHDDQHGTAIVTAAGMLNALVLTERDIKDTRFVCMGAGAAAITCCNLLLSLGATKENLLVVDSRGVIHAQRQGLTPTKQAFALETNHRTLEDALEGADVFLGLSGANLLSAEGLTSMAENPIVFACANPDPEIAPSLARQLRPDVILATGRSDYVNQVNNVLCFPFIFRGALDVRASDINHAMKVAAVKAIAAIAHQPVLQEVLDAYGLESLAFGSEYIIPKPTDPRLLSDVAAAVAQAAIDSGVAGKPYPEHYPLTSVQDIFPAANR
ncbi:MAG: malate dehydrogenase (oxaloacetate-decarboxylating)(NADP+) [Candidatus Azotimanducaceae bacterium]|jgi:malate dehydrogenase (oxaloacetate-decarboxylating)(NADP+)|tara:strand:- start:4672 stop:5952 length:1281 start_codon:yes stop_codon:yes gene_type:complete